MIKIETGDIFLIYGMGKEEKELDKEAVQAKVPYKFGVF